MMGLNLTMSGGIAHCATMSTTYSCSGAGRKLFVSHVDSNSSTLISSGFTSHCVLLHVAANLRFAVGVAGDGRWVFLIWCYGSLASGFLSAPPCPILSAHRLPKALQMAIGLSKRKACALLYWGAPILLMLSSM